ncbi:toll/interleukin-1 receptor domain-containing protein [Leucobacter sp. HY1910]
MPVNLFISYAWTSGEHREWVRLLASQLHLLGYNILIDSSVDYGDGLNGFMRKVVDAEHVLLVVDENYIERANTMPESGVGIETKWISEVHPDRPAGWLSVLFVSNPGRRMPDWLTEHNPKGFDFNASSETGNFPGSSQIDELWRWIEGLPADQANAVPIAEVRRRAARLERIENLRDPGNWSNPSLGGVVEFAYKDHPGGSYGVGAGEYQFSVSVSGCGADSIYVYSDPLRAVGLITDEQFQKSEVEAYLRPGRTVTPRVGQSVVLMNRHGNLCVVRIDAVQAEINDSAYVAPSVSFSYEILAL